MTSFMDLPFQPMTRIQRPKSTTAMRTSSADLSRMTQDWSRSFRTGFWSRFRIRRHRTNSPCQIRKQRVKLEFPRLSISYLVESKMDFSLVRHFYKFFWITTTKWMSCHLAFSEIFGQERNLTSFYIANFLISLWTNFCWKRHHLY